MNIIDGFGVYGSLVHYTLTILFVMLALVIFLYFWKVGRLDMDEEPKWQMMQSDEERHE